MTQFARPIGDDDVGSPAWTTTPLWSKIDDDAAGAGDGVFALSDSVGNNTNSSFYDAELTNTGGSDPSSQIDHVIRVRWFHQTSGRSMQAHIELWQGVPDVGSQIAEIISATNVGETEVEANYTLSAGEADSITDYNDLYFRFWGRGTGGGPGRQLHIEAAQFEFPDTVAGDKFIVPDAVTLNVTAGTAQVAHTSIDFEWQRGADDENASFAESTTMEAPGSNTFIYLIGTAKTVGGAGTLTATYDGVSMISLGTTLYGITDEGRCTIFGLANANAGPATIRLTSDQTEDEIVLTTVAYSGVDQVTPVDTAIFNVRDNFDTNVVTVGSELGDLVICSVATPLGVITNGANQIARVYNNNTTVIDSGYIAEEAGGSVDVASEFSFSSSRYSVGAAVNMNQSEDNQWVFLDGATISVTAGSAVITTGSVPIVPAAVTVNVTAGTLVVTQGLTLPFTDDFTDSNGEPWDVVKWTTSGVSDDFDIADIQSNRGRLAAGQDQDDWHTALAHSVTDIQDATVLVEAEGVEDDAVQKLFYVILRSSGDPSDVSDRAGRPSDAYYVRSDTDATRNDAILYRRIGHSETELDDFATSRVGHLERFLIRFEVEDSGTDVIIRSKIWDQTDSEPGSWDSEYTDTSPGVLLGATGVLQLLSRNRGGGTSDIDVRVDDVVFDAISGTGTQNIVPAAVTINVTAGTAVITTGSVAIVPAVVTINVTAGSVVITTGSVAIIPAAVTVNVAAGTVTVTTGSVNIVPDPVTVNVTAGTLDINAQQAIALTGPTLNVTAGSVVITTGSVAIIPSVVTVNVTAGTMTVTTLTPIVPDVVTLTVTPGSVVITTGSVPIVPAAVTLNVTAGTMVVTVGSTPIVPDAVTVNVTAGTLTVNALQAVALVQAAVNVTAGSMVVTVGSVAIVPDPVTITVTEGTLVVSLSGAPQDLIPVAVSITVTAGTMTVTTGSVPIIPDAVALNVTAGTLTITTTVALVPDPTIITVTAGTLSVNAQQAVSLAAASVSVAAGTAVITTGSVAIVPDAVTLNVTAGTMVVTTGSVAIVPDAVTLNVTAGTMVITTETPLGPTAASVIVTTGTLSISTLTPIIPDPVTLNVTAGTLTVTTEVDIVLAAAAITTTPGSAVITTGSVAIVPDPVTVTTTAGTIVVTQGQLVIPIAANVTTTSGTLVITTGPTNILLDNAVVTVSTGTMTLSEPGTGTSNTLMMMGLGI